MCQLCDKFKAENRYSEDQPRDPDGKFGSGGEDKFVTAYKAAIATMKAEQEKDRWGSKQYDAYNKATDLVAAAAAPVVNQIVASYPPDTGKTFYVIRVQGPDSKTLVGKNAADLQGVAQFLDSDAQEFTQGGSHLGLYEVTNDKAGKFGEYDALRGGSKDVKDGIGRSVNGMKWTGVEKQTSTWYSFGNKGYSAKLVNVVKMNELAMQADGAAKILAIHEALFGNKLANGGTYKPPKLRDDLKLGRSLRYEQKLKPPVSPDSSVASGTDRESLIEQTASQPEVHVHKFGTTQVDIPYGPAAHGLGNLRQLIPTEHLAGAGRDVGGSHVTVRYGLADDDHEHLRAFLSVQKPFEATIGSTISFPPSEHSDGAAVIVAPIDAPELHRIHAEIAQYATFKPDNFDYTPHATVAYVKSDKADLYVGCSMGQRFMVDSISIRTRDGHAETIPLAGKPQGTEQRMELVDFGPQGEPLFRYSPDQARDPDGKFATGSTVAEKERKDFTGTMTIAGQEIHLPQGREEKIAVVRAIAEREMAKLPEATQTVLKTPGDKVANTAILFTAGTHTDEKGNIQRDYKIDRENEVHLPLYEKGLAGHEPQDHPEVVFIAGGPAAGKSTEAAKASERMKDHVDVNIDKLRPNTPEFAACLPDNLGKLNEEMGDVRDRLISMAGEKGYNVLIDGVGSHTAADSVQKLIDQGYRATYVYVHRDVADAQKNAAARPYMTSKVADLRILQPSMVEGSHDKARREGFDDIAKRCAEIKIVDKSRPSFGKEGKVVFWKVDGVVKTYNAAGVRRVENGGTTKINIHKFR